MKLSLIRTRLPLALVFAMSALGCAPRTVTVSPESTPTLSVVGEAEASASPDLARVRLGVEERAPSPEDAMERANRRMAKVIDALKTKGIDKRDLQTTDLSMYFEEVREMPPSPRQMMQPSEARNELAPEEPRAERGVAPRGYYVVRNTVVVSVRQLERLGEVIGAAMSAGANQLQGFELTLDDASHLRDEARKKAIAQAIEKAKLLAKEANVKLGRIIEVSEGGGASPRPKMAGRAYALADSSVPVENGELTLSQSVNVIFALDE